MANFECKGLDRLIKKIEKISQVPERLKDEVVMDGAKEALKAQKNDAPKGSGDGAEALKITDVRKDEGYCFIDVGINAENFDKCRGIYFQNLDGERSSGEHIMWMQKSFKSVEKKIKDDITKKISKELDL